MRKMTEENLKAAFAGQSQAHMRYPIFAEVAIAGETHEVEEMYPAFLSVAELQKEQGAFHSALEAEKIHARMCQRAKEAAEAGQDLQ